MARLVLDDIPDELYRRLAERARDAGRSIEAETVQLLKTELASKGMRTHSGLTSVEILERLRGRPPFNPAEHGLPDSTTLLREDRDR